MTDATRKFAFASSEWLGVARTVLEELVAEQISARICYELGLPADLHESHASYIGHWLDILKSDKSAIITAAAKADQAFTYLAAFSGYDSEAQEEDHDTVELQACA